MDRGTLIDELNLLLDVGEPVLTAFPKKYQGDWALVLPNNISAEMRRYAEFVAWRAWNRNRSQGLWQQKTTAYLAGLVDTCEAGLLGWRAIGVLK